MSFFKKFKKNKTIDTNAEDSTTVNEYRATAMVDDQAYDAMTETYVDNAGDIDMNQEPSNDDILPEEDTILNDDNDDVIGPDEIGQEDNHLSNNTGPGLTAVNSEPSQDDASDETPMVVDEVSGHINTDTSYFDKDNDMHDVLNHVTTVLHDNGLDSTVESTNVGTYQVHVDIEPMSLIMELDDNVAAAVIVADDGTSRSICFNPLRDSELHGIIEAVNQ